MFDEVPKFARFICNAVDTNINSIAKAFMDGGSEHIEIFPLQLSLSEITNGHPSKDCLSC